MPSYEDFQRDYWAPDRDQVLASMAPQNYQAPTQAAQPTGQVGQYMPQGYDQGKFNDAGKNDPKYNIGRILSKYPPGPDGLRAAANELGQIGYKVIGDDKIVGSDGYPVDVGQNFKGSAAGQGNANWWFNPTNPDNNAWKNSSGANMDNGLNGILQMFQKMLGGGNNQPVSSQPTQQNPTSNYFQNLPQTGGFAGWNPMNPPPGQMGSSQPMSSMMSGGNNMGGGGNIGSGGGTLLGSIAPGGRSNWMPPAGNGMNRNPGFSAGNSGNGMNNGGMFKPPMGAPSGFTNQPPQVSNPNQRANPYQRIG